MKKLAVLLAVSVGLIVAAPGIAGAATPPRVLLVGDSITASYQDTAVAALTAKGYSAGGVGLPSSGLLDTGRCDGSYAANLARFFHPSVVVIEYTGGYGHFSECVDKKIGSAGFRAKWREAAKKTQNAFVKAGAKVIWVLPPMPNTVWPQAKLFPALNTDYRTVAALKGEQTVDAWTVFGGDAYNWPLHSDGIHLSPSGVTTFADLVVRAVG